MAQQPRWCVLACREWGISVLGLRRHGSTEKYPYASALRRRLTWTILPTDRWCRNWSSPWGAPMIKCHADTTPAGRGFRSGGCARLPLRECVPAGFPEPYLYDRLFSGSEIAVGGVEPEPLLRGE